MSSPASGVSRAARCGDPYLRPARWRGFMGLRAVALRARLLQRLGALLGLVRRAALALGDVGELLGVLLGRVGTAALVEEVLRLVGESLEVHSTSIPRHHRHARVVAATRGRR